MSFEPKKYLEIFEDMRGRSGSVVTDFEVGSVARTLYESFSYELALLYEKMYRTYLAGYVDTAEGLQLEQVVAVLGIKRGLPDFAAGEVTFIRDLGENAITIPLGTLVATEEAEDKSKKAYQTIEPAVIPKVSQQVKVRIQAVERGEGQVAAAETIIVMPRPVPGIKTVINESELQFKGKRRETDDELRERAKNALISSGKASKIAIENAVFTMDGIKAVKLKEDFSNVDGYGSFKLYIDGQDVEEDSFRQAVREKVDEVRAAGVFYEVLTVEKITITSFELSVLQDPNLVLSDNEKDGLREKVKAAIFNVLANLKIGETAFFSSLIKEVLLVEGIINLDLDSLNVTIEKPDSTTETKAFSDKEIIVDEFERIEVEADDIHITLN